MKTAKPARRRRRRTGRCRLAIWIPLRMRTDLQLAAETEGRSQRQIVEAALRAYFSQTLPEQPAPKIP